MERNMTMGVHKDDLFAKQTQSTPRSKAETKTWVPTKDRQACSFPSQGGFWRRKMIFRKWSQENWLRIFWSLKLQTVSSCWGVWVMAVHKLSSPVWRKPRDWSWIKIWEHVDNPAKVILKSTLFKILPASVGKCATITLLTCYVR